MPIIRLQGTRTFWHLGAESRKASNHWKRKRRWHNGSGQQKAYVGGRAPNQASINSPRHASGYCGAWRCAWPFEKFYSTRLRLFRSRFAGRAGILSVYRAWASVGARFFALSGFLVGGPAFRAILHGDWNWERYMIKRLTRLWIVLIPALLLTLGLDTAGEILGGSAGYTGGFYGLISSGPSSHFTCRPVAHDACCQPSIFANNCSPYIRIEWTIMELG